MEAETKEQRFREMKELFKKYRTFYIQHILEEKKKVRNTEVRKMLNEFVIGRMASKPGIRAYIFEKMWDILSLPKNSTFYKLCVGIEMQLGQTYSFNVGADKKCGYGKRYTTAFLTAKEMKRIHKSFFVKCFPNHYNEIWKIFDEIYDVFYSAQIFDTIINLYPNIGKSIHSILQNSIQADEEEFYMNFGIEKKYLMRVYSKFKFHKFEFKTLPFFVLKRTYGINAHMIEHYPLLIKVFYPEIGRKEILALSGYGRYYGISMMITNDIQDFALDLLADESTPRAKTKTDAFNDVINQKITWPIMYALLDSDDIAKEIIHKAYTKPTQENLELLRKMLLSKEYIKQAVLESLSYAHLAIENLSNFSNTSHKEMLTHVAISMSLFTKYHKLLKHFYNIHLRPSKSSIRKRKTELIKVMKNEKQIFDI